MFWWELLCTAESTVSFYWLRAASVPTDTSLSTTLLHNSEPVCVLCLMSYGLTDWELFKFHHHNFTCICWSFLTLSDKNNNIIILSPDWPQYSRHTFAIIFSTVAVSLHKLDLICMRSSLDLREILKRLAEMMISCHIGGTSFKHRGLLKGPTNQNDGGWWWEEP